MDKKTKSTKKYIKYQSEIKLLGDQAIEEKKQKYWSINYKLKEIRLSLYKSTVLIFSLVGNLVLEV
jgi:hypothetical protein